MRSLTLAALVVAAIVPVPALGHGGGYRDGPREIPPETREPWDPPPSPGQSAAGRGPDSTAPAYARARDRVTSALRALLADELLVQRTHERGIRAAAAIALARSGDAAIVETLRQCVSGRDECPDVRRAALLGLGLAKDESHSTRALLIEFVKHTGGDDEGARQFAALSLGLLGADDDRDGDSVAALVEMVASNTSTSDLKRACLVALGLLDDERATAGLVAMVQAGRDAAPAAAKLKGNEIAFAVAALGMNGRPGDDDCALAAVKDLVPRASSEPSSDLRCVAEIALGRIAVHCGPALRCEAADLLIDGARDGGASDSERLDAITALGRVGATPGDARTRAQVVAFLGTAIRSDDSRVASHAAVALGVVGRVIADEECGARQTDICEPLRAAFASASSTESRRAAVFAWALSRDPIATDTFLAVVRDGLADSDLRGCCADAIGMTGDPVNLTALREAAQDATDPGLRAQLATAAATLGDPSAVAGLLRVLHDRDAGSPQLESAAQALSRVADDRAIDGLLKIAADNGCTDSTRVLAIAALGRISDRRYAAKLACAAADLARLSCSASVQALLALR